MRAWQVTRYGNPTKALELPVPVPRFNPPTTDIGRQVQERLVEMLAAGTIHPVVGATVPFEGLPVALEEMEARRTVGRTVVTR